jgi:hypothetical protein
MSTFTLRAEFDGGRNVEIAPTHVRPLGVAAIRAFEVDESAPVEMELFSDGALVEGVERSDRVRMKAKVVFNKQTTIFALIRGGWVPMPFVIPPRFLVDRNVVISLRHIREGKTVANAESFQWWTLFFEHAGALFNPLPYAYEAGFRRKPTMAEFAAAYDEGATELAGAFPACEVVKFTDVNYRAAYCQLEAFDQRATREVAFLQSACPLVTHRVSRRNEWAIADEIACIADLQQVNRASLPCLAIMSCLFEATDGKTPAIGRRVIKPKLSYSDDDAFNALSDLRHMEIAAAGQAYFNEGAFSLCTCDRPLALLWSALALRGEGTTNSSMDIAFDLTEEAFARLDADGIQKLKQLLRA